MNDLIRRLPDIPARVVIMSLAIGVAVIIELAMLLGPQITSGPYLGQSGVCDSYGGIRMEGSPTPQPCEQDAKAGGGARILCPVGGFGLQHAAAQTPRPPLPPGCSYGN